MNGFGTTFWRENVSNVFEKVAGIRNFGEQEATADTHETTEVDQDDNYKTFDGGLIDPGEFELELTWKDRATADAAHTGLLDDLGKLGRFQTRLPTAGKTSFTYDAVVTSIGEAFPVEGEIARKVKFKRSGKPVEGVWT